MSRFNLIALVLLSYATYSYGQNFTGINCNETFFMTIEIHNNTGNKIECWRWRALYDGRYTLYSQITVCQNEAVHIKGMVGEDGTQYFVINVTGKEPKIIKKCGWQKRSRYLPFMDMFVVNHHTFCMHRYILSTAEYNICETLDRNNSTSATESAPTASKVHGPRITHIESKSNTTALIVGVSLGILYLITVCGLVALIWHMKRASKYGVETETPFIGFDNLTVHHQEQQNET